MPHGYYGVRGSSACPGGAFILNISSGIETTGVATNRDEPLRVTCGREFIVLPCQNLQQPHCFLRSEASSIQVARTAHSLHGPAEGLIAMSLEQFIAVRRNAICAQQPEPK